MTHFITLQRERYDGRVPVNFTQIAYMTAAGGGTAISFSGGAGIVVRQSIDEIRAKIAAAIEGFDDFEDDEGGDADEDETASAEAALPLAARLSRHAAAAATTTAAAAAPVKAAAAPRAKPTPAAKADKAPPAAKTVTGAEKAIATAAANEAQTGT